MQSVGYGAAVRWPNAPAWLGCADLLCCAAAVGAASGARLALNLGLKLSHEPKHWTKGLLLH